jgi:nuclear pore complex protein Nup98-Nup96
MVDDNGDCFAEDLVIGRDGFGNVMFPGVTNIASMNLDEIGRLYESAM